MYKPDLNKVLQQTHLEVAFVFDLDLRCMEIIGDPSCIGVIETDGDPRITDLLRNIPGNIEQIARDGLAGRTSRQSFKLEGQVYLLIAAPMEDVEGVGILSIMNVTETKDIWENHRRNTLEQERSTLVQNFIRDVSHEFRSPITAIKIELYLLSREKDAQKQAARIRQIEKRADEIIELVDDLKAMATVDYAEHTAVEIIDLNVVTRTAYQIALGQSSQGSQLIRLKTHAGDLQLLANRDELLRALIEVISNAIRYTPPTGSIVINTTSQDGWHTVTVTDDGQGMDEATLASAFMRFQRGDAAHTTRGLGLGLPMTKRIIERNNGKISITSKLLEGTTVTMTFPQPKNKDLFNANLNNRLSSSLLG